MRFPLLFSGGLLACTAAAAISAGTTDLLPGGIRLLEPMPPSPDVVTTRVVLVEGQEFPEALEATTLKASDRIYDVQVTAPVPVATKEGDVVLVEFSLRTISTSAESGEAKTQMCLEQKGGDFKKSIEYDVAAGPGWTKYQVPFRVRSADGAGYAPGGAQLCFRLGYGPQTLQIGGFRAVDYGPGYDIDSLPKTRFDYPGRASDAPWRAEARKRIDELRKAPLAVHVVDGSGHPVAGATVEVRMTRSEFRFGSAVDLKYFAKAGDPDAQRYRQYVLDHFNQITPENDLKWDWWSWGAADRPALLQTLDTLGQNGIRVHGHCLIWPGGARVPKEVQAAFGNREALDGFIDAHLREILGATRGEIAEWDAVNEPYAERDILNRYGDGLVGDWFSLIHQIDPTPRLYLNDYANFQAGGDDTPHKRDFEKRLRDLLAAQAPVQGIGMQSHFGMQPCPPEAVIRELDRFARLGLPIQITEFDMDGDDGQLKADYTRDFMTACFSHSAVVGFTCWGFWEGRHYKPSAAMVRKDWSITPWGQAWLDLVEKEWRTQASGPTDAAGDYRVRAFLGDYAVSVRLGDRTVAATTTLGKDSPILRVEIKR